MSTETADVDVLAERLLDDLRAYLHLPDPTHVLAVLAVAATADEPGTGPPVWLQVIGAPGSGKTEILRLLGAVQTANTASVTPAALLRWGPGGRVSGLLAGVQCGLIVFRDFSSVLDRPSSRDDLYAVLREVADGALVRDVAGPLARPGEQLRWTGRATLIAAATPSIDRRWSHHTALGERWLSVRLPATTLADQRAAARAAREAPDGMAERARGSATRLVRAARRRLGEVKIDESTADAIETVALAVAYTRTPITRVRRVPDVGAVEGVGRLVQQLRGLARGLLAIGVEADELIEVVRRVGRDSVPPGRSAVLTAMAGSDEGWSRPGLERVTGIDVEYPLADLAALGVIAASDTREEPGQHGRGWILAGEVAPLVREVWAAGEMA